MSDKSPHNPVFKYRFQACDGSVHVAIGREACIHTCAVLEREFGPKGYALLLPLEVATAADGRAA